MNILAEEQKKMFEKGITQEEFIKREKEFLELYYRLRMKDEDRFWSKLSLQQRKKIHKIILSIYKLKNRLGGFHYNLIKDDRTATNRPIIYAVTHIGKFDIEVISEAIKDHYYLLSGDYEHLQGTIDAPFIGLNGVIYFNEKVKEDRKSASEKMIKHLQDGGNLMYFPEGTWNLTPNLPVLPLYWGIVEIAKTGNAIIVPIAADQIDKLFTINIGKNFDMNEYGDTKEEKTKAINDLRDTLATLKWNIWESYGIFKREKISIEWDEFVNSRLREWPYFNNEYIDALIFKPKEYVSHDEVYAPIKKLIPNRDNAFLFDNRSNYARGNRVNATNRG